MASNSQGSVYHSYLDLERRSGETIDEPATGSSSSSSPAPLKISQYLQAPGPSETKGPKTATSNSRKALIYSFPLMSGSLPALLPPPDYQTQSRRRPGSQAPPADIKFLSSPPGISQLSLPLNTSQVHQNQAPPPPLPKQPLEIQEVIDISPHAHPTSTIPPPSVVHTAPPSIITSQPNLSPPMSTTFKGTRNAKCLETGLDGKRSWSAGLFECEKEHTIGDCQSIFTP
ncbi:hypothetical protein AAF712_003280 [Marasmius tenuissimus]|uniref:Uncharacterized protein n=1 Tax=Marasmius tenuissimus TaxID=585030 RepID=A0ABR3A8C2_9AGAR